MVITKTGGGLIVGAHMILVDLYERAPLLICLDLVSLKVLPPNSSTPFQTCVCGKAMLEKHLLPTYCQQEEETCIRNYGSNYMKCNIKCRFLSVQKSNYFLM